MKVKITIILFLASLLMLSGCTKDSTKVIADEKNTNYTTEIKKEGNKDSSLDLSKFNITKVEDEKSGVMIMPQTTNDSWILKFKKFTGAHTMGKLTLEKDQSISLKYTSKIDSGKLNLLILNKNYDIIRSEDGNIEKTIELNAVESSEYIIKVVGDEASTGEVVVKFR